MDNVFESLYAGRELSSLLFRRVCEKYGITPAEMIILLFLANDRAHDTATEIVEKLKIAKSHVSVSVRALAERGYLTGSYRGGNHRTIHLELCESAKDIVAAGRGVQAEFEKVAEEGFSEEELENLRSYMMRIQLNVRNYLKDNRTEVKSNGGKEEKEARNENKQDE